MQDKVIELMATLSFLQGSQINNPSHETEQVINRLKEEIAAIRSTQDEHRSFAAELEQHVKNMQSKEKYHIVIDDII